MSNKPPEEKNENNHQPWAKRKFGERKDTPVITDEEVSKFLKENVENYESFDLKPRCQGVLQDISDRFEIGNFNSLDLSPIYFKLMAMINNLKSDILDNVIIYLPTAPRKILLAIRVATKIIKQVKENIECALQIVSEINSLITYYNAKLLEALNAVEASIKEIKKVKQELLDLDVKALITEFGADIVGGYLAHTGVLDSSADFFYAATECLKTADNLKQAGQDLLDSEFILLRKQRDEYHDATVSDKSSGGTSFKGSAQPGPKSIWGADGHVDAAFKDIKKKAEFRKIKALERAHRTAAADLQQSGKIMENLETTKDSIPGKVKKYFEAEKNIELLPDNLEQLSDEILAIAIDSNSDCSSDEYARLCKDNFFQFGVVALEEATKPLVKVVFPKPYDEIPERITVTLKLPDDYPLDDTNFDDNPPDPLPIIEELGTLPSVTTLRHTKESFWVYIGKRAVSHHSGDLVPNPPSGSPDLYSNKIGYYVLPETEGVPDEEDYQFMGLHDIGWSVQWQSVGIRSEANDTIIKDVQDRIDDFERRMQEGIPGQPTGLSSNILDSTTDDGDNDDNTTGDGGTTTGEERPMPQTVSQSKTSIYSITSGYTPVASGSDAMEIIGVSYDLMFSDSCEIMLRFVIDGDVKVEAPLTSFASVTRTSAGTSGTSFMSYWHDRIKSTSGSWSIELKNPTPLTQPPQYNGHYANVYIQVAHYS